MLVAAADMVDHFFMRWNMERPPLCILVERTGDRVMVITVLAVVIGMSASYRGAGTGALSEVPSVLVALPALIIVIREVLVAALREFLSAARLPVTVLARVKTGLQIGAVFLLLLVHALPALQMAVGGGGFSVIDGPPYEREMVWAAVILLWAAAGVTVWSAIDYFREGWPQVVARAGH